jgi:LmbE family N-acetylglucosaminyl deacetylase
MLGLQLALAHDHPRILCLGAHCDDIEIGCGGTVLRLLERYPAARLTWVVLSSTPARALEAQAAARELLGGDDRHRVIVREFRDGYLPMAAAEIKGFLHELRAEAEPDLVLCHHRGDLHQDHRIVGELAWQTFRDHLIWEYEIPKYDGDLGRPNLYVPLPDRDVDRKVALILRHYPSQAAKPWFTPETFRALLRLRGVEAGVAWAEAFHAPKTVVG